MISCIMIIEGENASKDDGMMVEGCSTGLEHTLATRSIQMMKRFSFSSHQQNKETRTWKNSWNCLLVLLIHI